MRARLCLVCGLLLVATAAAGAETAPQTLAKVPPLPRAAAGDLDCSFGEKLRLKVDALNQRNAAAVQSAASPTTSLTPEQMQALQSLTDPAYTMCPIEAMQPEAQAWAPPAEEKLSARLAEIDAAKQKSDQAYCEAHSTSPTSCEFDAAGARRFNAQATAAGTQYLKDVQPGYAKYLKQVTDCVAMRDKPVAAAQGVKGAFSAVVVGADGQNWWLVLMAAEAQSKACNAARDAARKYLDSP